MDVVIGGGMVSSFEEQSLKPLWTEIVQSFWIVKNLPTITATITVTNQAMKIPKENVTSGSL